MRCHGPGSGLDSGNIGRVTRGMSGVARSALAPPFDLELDRRESKDMGTLFLTLPPRYVLLQLVLYLGPRELEAASCVQARLDYWIVWNGTEKISGVPHILSAVIYSA